MAAVAESANGTEDRQFAPPSAASDRNSEFRRDVRKLVDLLSKLNPSAKEFVPSSHATAAAAPPPALATLPGPAVAGDRISNGVLSADAPVFVVAASDQSDGYKDSSSEGSLKNFRRKSNYTHGGRKRINQRVLKAQREESIRRTVYVSDIDQQITEQQLATLFASCSQVVDCRICGDPHSVLRFAFVEFVDEEGARAALNLSGTVLGFYPVRVLPSKTAILPVNPTFLPRSEDEREMCTRTIYCTNIDKKTTQQEVRVFFESICGKVSCLRLLGDRVHSTHIAFVEFAQAESAILALSCSGMVLGELPIRVSPSKTPVRPWVPCATMH